MSDTPNQDDVVDFLTRRTSYPHEVDSVELRETHGSRVFLAGPYVYKLKKEVAFGFLDYSSIEKRRHACEEEVRLNRRLAPGIYLGVLSIREIEGELRLCALEESRGAAVDFVVHMVRVDDDLLLRERLSKGELTDEQLRALVDVLTSFYAHAETGPHIDRYGEPEVIRRNVAENFAETQEWVGSMFAERRFHALRSAPPVLCDPAGRQASPARRGRTHPGRARRPARRARGFRSRARGDRLHRVRRPLPLRRCRFGPGVPVHGPRVPGVPQDGEAAHSVLRRGFRG